MRKLTYPSWTHWQIAVEEGLRLATASAELTTYRIDGAPTRQKVTIKSPDEHLGNMPFVQTALTGINEGWDEEESATLDYEGHTYTDLGGTKSVKQTNYYRERLTWTVEIFAQKYLDAIEVAQSIRRYFGPRNTFAMTYRGETYYCFCGLSDFNIMPAETGREGNTEFFLATWDLTLSIKSDLSDEDGFTKNIVDVVVDTIASDGTNDSDELEKTV